MGRIRTIKPEFPQSEGVGSLSRDSRLLFIQLWTIVDDEGRTRAASRMLASLLYPYDNDAAELMEGWLTELEQKGFVRRYVADGATYLEVLNWLKHQKIQHPSASRHPPFTGSLSNPHEDSVILTPDLGPRTKDQDAEPTARLSLVPDIPAQKETELEVELFDRGKKLLGKSSGGLIKNLLKAKNGSVALARSAIEVASTKQNPREYLGAIIRNRDGSDDARLRGDAW